MITGNVLYDSGVLLQERYDKLLEENRRLREALEKYGRHKALCKTTDRYAPSDTPCTCGFSAAAKEAGK